MADRRNLACFRRVTVNVWGCEEQPRSFARCGTPPGLSTKKGEPVSKTYLWLAFPIPTFRLNSADWFRGTLNDCQRSCAKCFANSTICPT